MIDDSIFSTPFDKKVHTGCQIECFRLAIRQNVRKITTGHSQRSSYNSMVESRNKWTLMWSRIKASVITEWSYGGHPLYLQSVR